MNIKDKHDFILYNKDEGKWYDTTLRLINLQVINKGMGFKEQFNDQESYAAAQAKAYKAEQENRKIINDREHFNSTLLESASEVFIPLTTNQDKSLKEEQKIVKEIIDLSKSFKAIKDEPKVDEQKKEVEKHEKDEEDEEIEEQEEEDIKVKETFSKNECMDLINTDDIMDELFAITEYKDNKIRFHIFDDLQRFNLIEYHNDHNIEFIE